MYTRTSLIIENDDVHSFGYVMFLLNRIFKIDPENCAAFASQIHREGQAVIWTGHHEHAEYYLECIKDAPIDPHTNCLYPLRARLQPVTTG